MELCEFGEDEDLEDIEDYFFADWPGVVYHPEDEEFRALLGTVHGKGIVHMLVDRPYALRDDRRRFLNITTITMFTTLGDDHYYNLLFTLG